MSVPVPDSLLHSLDGRRLLIVSNRLPISIKKSEKSYSFSPSSGGLVTGLRGLGQITNFLWYGSPGQEFPEADLAELQTTLLEKHNAIPVLMDEETSNKHYNGFSSEFRLVVTTALV